LIIKFTAAQAAQKKKNVDGTAKYPFTAAQAAQKMKNGFKIAVKIVHCRTGSSETVCFPPAPPVQRSLPHRQLRKVANVQCKSKARSLPHRQLRNFGVMRTCSVTLFTAAQAAQK